MIQNPILAREVLTVLRTRRALAVLLLVALLFTLLLLLRWPTDGRVDLSGAPSREVFRLFAYGLTGVLLLLVPALPATMLVRERNQGTLALLINSPLPAWAIYLGKLLAVVLMAVLVMVMSLPAATACYAMGGVSLRHDLLLLYGLLLLVTIQLSALALWVSSHALSTDSAIRTTYGLVFVLVVVTLGPHLYYEGQPGWIPQAAAWLRALSPLPAVMELLGHGDLAGAGIAGQAAAAPRYALLVTLGTLLLGAATIGRLASPLLDRSRPAGRITEDRSRSVRWARRLFFLVDPQRRSASIGRWTNPVLVKEFRSRRFGRLHWLLRLAAACTLVSMLLTYAAATGSIQQGPEAMGGVLVALQGTLIILLTPSLAAGLISSERERGGWTLLQMTPLSPGAILRGKLLSVLVTVTLIVLATVPGYLMMMFIEPVLRYQILRVLISLGWTAAFAILLSTLVSSLFRRTALATTTAYLLLGGLWGGTLLIWMAREAPFGHATVQNALAINPLAAALAVIETPGFTQYHLVPLNWWLMGFSCLVLLVLLRLQIWRLTSPQFLLLAVAFVFQATGVAAQQEGAAPAASQDARQDAREEVADPDAAPGDDEPPGATWPPPGLPSWVGPSDPLDSAMDRDPLIELPAPPQPYVESRYLSLWLQALGRAEVDMQRQAAETIARAQRRGMRGAEAAIEPLLAVLQQTPSDSVAVQAAARTLVQLDARQHADLLRAAAVAGGREVAQLVEPALARWGDPAMAPLWTERLADPRSPLWQQRLALEAVGIMRLSSASEELRRRCLDDSQPPGLRLQAARALSRIEPQGLEPLARRLAGHSAEADPPAENPRPSNSLERLLAASLLDQHESEAARELWTVLAADSQGEVAAMAWQRLLEQDLERLLPLAPEALRHTDYQVRRLAVRALSARPTAERVSRLLPVLDDLHPQVRSETRLVLLQLAQDPDWETLILQGAMEPLQEGSWRGIQQATFLLAELEHQPAADRLVELLDFPHPRVFVTAAWGLGRLGVEETFPAMLEKAERVSREEREGAQADWANRWQLVSQLFQAFGKNRFDGAEELMRTYIPKDSARDPETRAAAIWALGKLYADSPQEDLEAEFASRLADISPMDPEEPRVRLMSAVALGHMGGRGGLSTLQRFYRAEGILSELHHACRWSLERITGESWPLGPLPQPRAISGWFLQPMEP